METRPWSARVLLHGFDVNPRRFVAVANPGLTRLITERIGQGWLQDLRELRGLEAFAADTNFQVRRREVKLGAEKALATLVKERLGVQLKPESLFNILCKRIHEYKRQHLNILHLLTPFI